MPLSAISREALEVLYQNVRSPGIAPGAVPPSAGTAAAPEDAGYRVSDDFIRVVPFVRVEIDGRPHARQYQVQSVGDLLEPPFTAGAAASPWTPGATSSFGQDLAAVGRRFKKISASPSIDELMAGSGAEDDVLAEQVVLTSTGIVRSLSKAFWASDPATDDDATLAGLPSYLPANSAQDVLYDPARGLIGGLSELIARCRPGDDGFGTGADALVLTSRCDWRLAEEERRRGVTPDFRECGLTGRVRHHFAGVPILHGALPEPGGAVDPRTEAWAVTLRGPSAVRVLHVGGDRFGVRVDPVTTFASRDARGEIQTATRGVEVYGVYSVLVPDPFAVARLRGIPARDVYSQA